MLHQPCRQVSSFGADLGQLIDDMFASMAIAEGVGLAAPQVGVDLAVFVYDCLDADGKRHVGHVVNPTIETSGAPEEHDEGCLSVPGPYHELSRPTVVTVHGVDRTGAPVEVTGTGFFARCLQHETDHLDGLIYIDRLVGRNQRAGRKAVKRNGWGVPGLSWDPSSQHAEDV